MGIPFFFSSLASRHDLVVPPQSVLQPDVLAFDYNCLIHTVAQSVARASHATTEAQLHREVLKGISRYTTDIVVAVKPKRVYVAIDGVPPVAKLLQQRKRRFMAILERSYKGGEGSQAAGSATRLWTSNVVTPGTAFMQRLHAYLSKELPRVSPHLEFSSWNEPGEGEHKIFRWLAAAFGTPPSTSALPSVMIYGMDADMILLSMLHCVHPQRQRCSVCLLRERQESMPQTGGGEGQASLFADFDVVSIERVMAAVLPRLGRHLDPQTAVINYVLLAALMGNDFLPPLSYLKIRAPGDGRGRPGMERLVELAGPLLSSGDSFARWETSSGTNSGHVNFAALLPLVADLSRMEDQRMQEAYTDYLQPPRRPRPGDTAAEHRWKHLPLLLEEHQEVRLVDPTRPGWRLQYQSCLFPRGTDPEAVLREYASGLEWVMRYYITNTAPAEEWSFPFCYSPTAQALHHFLLKQTGQAVASLDSSYKLPFTITPELQLLAVTPPGSKSILSAAQRRVMDDVEHRFMFPDSFRLHTWLKGVAWECCPQLPPLDLPRLHAAVERLAAKKTAKNVSSNMHGV